MNYEIHIVYYATDKIYDTVRNERRNLSFYACSKGTYNLMEEK